ncbi:hypothetical protein [Halovenus salina]|uniref:Uncharacterized protein n=1 Tax=Halovenus salina TaxID=1510225 RepID=A0ABD5W9L1_9EURY
MLPPLAHPWNLLAIPPNDPSNHSLMILNLVRKLLAQSTYQLVENPTLEFCRPHWYNSTSIVFVWDLPRQSVGLIHPVLHDNPLLNRWLRNIQSHQQVQRLSHPRLTAQIDVLQNLTSRRRPLLSEVLQDLCTVGLKRDTPEAVFDLRSEILRRRHLRDPDTTAETPRL